MIRTLPFVVLLALACDGPTGEPDCLSSCGARGYGMTDCAAFQRAEDSAVAAMGTYVTGWSAAGACSALQGWRVEVLDEADFDRYHGTSSDRHGVTYPEVKHVAVVRAAAWQRSFFPHEMGHVVSLALDDRAALAAAPLDCDPSKVSCDEDHKLWLSRGVFTAIGVAMHDPAPGEMQ